MSSALIIDNWLLQDVGACLAEGLDSGESSEIQIRRRQNAHRYIDVPRAAVQIEALIALLIDIVLRDSLLVDSGFTAAWRRYKKNLTPLTDHGLVRAVDFRAAENRLPEVTKLIVDQLCVTRSLQEVQTLNEEGWRESRRLHDPYTSQIIWGTAGMLGRSHIFEAPYSGHPLRRRLLEQTFMSRTKRDVVTETLEWMKSERMRIYEMRNEGSVVRQAILVLPPVVIDVIEEARTADQLIPVALQMRDRHRKLREWLKTIQIAVDSEDAKTIASYRKTLEAVARDIGREIGKDEETAPRISLEIGFGLPSISFDLTTIDGIRKRFGMRAILSQQVFSARGEASLKKLLNMFGEKRTRLSVSVHEYLRVHGGR